jgi:hypothetical protein
LHGNADSLSRWPLPDKDEDGFDDYNDILINCIILRTESSFMKITQREISNQNNDKWMVFNVQYIGLRLVNGAHMQESDSNIQYIIKQMRERVQPEAIPIQNKEQRIFIKEWKNLVVHKDTLRRQATDKIGNEFNQFIGPSIQRSATMELMHSNRLSGHLMMEKTFNRIASRFFWPFMKRDIQKFISECEKCQLATHPHRNPKALLKPIKVNRVLEMVTSDFMGPLKRSKKGNINIIVLTDQKTKYAWLRATRDQLETTTAPIIAKVQLEFGIFEKLLTDQGRNYESNFIAELCHFLDTYKLHTTPFHAQCDGLSERLNQTVIKMIKTFINDDHSDWDELLPSLEYAYNTAVHATTGMTPYFMMFGRHPKCPEDLILNKPEIDFHVSADSYAFNLKENLKKAFAAIRKTSDMKIDLSQIRYNRDHIACKFEIGDQVLVRQFKVEPGACPKFSNKWRGPYVVLNRKDQLVYSLKPVKAKG